MKPPAKWVIFEKNSDGHRSNYIRYFKKVVTSEHTTQIKTTIGKNVIFPTLDGNEIVFFITSFFNIFFQKKIFALSIRPHEKRSLIKHIAWNFSLHTVTKLSIVKLFCPIKTDQKNQKGLLKHYTYYPDPELLLYEKKIYKASPKIYNISLLGLLKENKNTDLFYQLMSSKKLTGCAAGTIPEEKTKEKLKLHTNTLIPEYISENDMQKIIKSSDCVFCLYKKNQSSGIAYKSLSLGTPVLVWEKSILAKKALPGLIEVPKKASTDQIISTIMNLKTINRDLIINQFNSYLEKERKIAESINKTIF